MFAYLKQSTASQSRLVGPFVDDTDFKTAETGLTIANTDVKLSKNGAAGADKNSGGGTHRNNGMYSLTFDATDTDTVGELAGSIAVSGALVVTFKFWVLEESIYDAMFGASAAGFDSNQRVDVGSVLGTAQTAGDLMGSIGEENAAAAAGDPSTTESLMQYVKQLINVLMGTAGIGTWPAAAAPGNGVSIAEALRATFDDTNSLEGTKIPDTLSLANINTEVDTALTDIGLDHLLSAAVVGADVTDNSALAKLVSASATADWDDFVNTTDALQAIRDRGDAAWITGSGTGLTALASGTAQGGTASTIQLATGESFANDELNGNVVKITSGTGAGQARVITDYTGSTDTADVTPDWITNPDATSVYEVVEGSANVVAWLLNVVTASSGNPDVNVESLDDIDLSATMKASVNTEADTALTDYDPPTRAEATSDKDEILGVLDEGPILVRTTIATLASQVSFTLTAGSADNDAYNGMIAVVTDVSTAAQKCIGVISDYVGSTKTVALREDPGVFTMAATDKITILAISPDVLDILADVTGLNGDAMRGTDSAALASVCTEARLAELDAANLPSDVDDILTDTADMQPKLGTPAGADISADLATIDTVVDGIQTDLDNGTDGLGAIKTTADAIETDTQDIQSRLPAALVSGKMDSDATAISGDTTAADRLEALMDGSILAQVNDASATTTAFAADGFTEATDDHFNGRLITFVTGALTGQQTDISDYDAAGHAQGSQAFTVTALTEAPADDDWFVIH